MKTYEKIRQARELKHWSQENMAEKLQMSPSGYAKIERGESSLSLPRLEQISEILEVDVIDLLDDENNNIVYQQANIGDNNNGISFYANSNENLKNEIEKLQIIIAHPKELLVQKDKEIAMQTELLELYKNKS